jgi:hypothetical protein
MPIIINLFLLVFLLILFILFTSIGLTFKLTVLNLNKRKEFGSTFTVKWLLFSHTFSIEEPKAATIPSKEPDKSKAEKERVETGDRRDKKGVEQRKYETEDLLKEEDKIKAEKRKDPEEKRFEPEEGMTTREILSWGLKGFGALRRPLFNLFSDLLHGIKIKRLESCMTFGLSDPADTGMLCGFIHSVSGFLYSRCKYCSFSINPVFMDPILDFQGNAEVRVRIHSLIFPFIKFTFNRKTLSFTYSVVKELLQRKWKSEWKPKWKPKWKFNS